MLSSKYNILGEHTMILMEAYTGESLCKRILIENFDPVETEHLVRS